MALVLVLETGAGLSSSNSYATAAEGNTYHDSHLYAKKWTNASTSDKEKALAMATRTLDDNMTWNGSRNSKGQALRWPRVGAYDQDGFLIVNNTLPTNLKDATIEMARLLLTSDRTAEPDSKGLLEVKADTVNVKFDKTDRDQGGVIPNTIKQMLKSFGTVLNRNTSQAKAVRV